MPATRRPVKTEHDSGTTIIEVSLILVIIGVLAAIAIPVFMHATSRAHDSQTLADARYAATLEESYLVDHNSYVGGDPTAVLGGEGYQNSHDTAQVVIYTYQPGPTQTGRRTDGSGSYCIDAQSASGGHVFVNSLTGAVSDTATCPE